MTRKRANLDRDNAIRAAYQDGADPAALAAEHGLTKGRVYQLVAGLERGASAPATEAVVSPVPGGRILGNQWARVLELAGLERHHAAGVMDAWVQDGVVLVTGRSGYELDGQRHRVYPFHAATVEPEFLSWPSEDAIGWNRYRAGFSILPPERVHHYGALALIGAQVLSLAYASAQLTITAAPIDDDAEGFVLEVVGRVPGTRIRLSGAPYSAATVEEVIHQAFDAQAQPARLRAVVDRIGAATNGGSDV